MKCNLTFLGAAQTVTGSKYLLSYKGHNLMIDCGLFQGEKRGRLKNWEKLDFDESKIDSVLLTHSHLDHCGHLPKLIRDGFKGNIYCTEATLDLSYLILMDSAKIQMQDAKEANEKGYSKHKPAKPLYYDHEVKYCLTKFKTVNYEDSFKLGPFYITYYQAGHIPGAASIAISWDSGSILFSGDIGRSDDIFTFDPDCKSTKYDNIVMETTYGGKVRQNIDPIQELKEVVLKSKKNNSIVLVPSFSLGRAQVLMIYFRELFEKFPELKIPIYLDSPMSTEVTKTVIRNHRFVRPSLDELENYFSDVKFIAHHWESKKIHENMAPKIIISSSGMLTGGRVLDHILTLGKDEKNIIYIPGFQAPGTRGKDLIDGERVIKIKGQEFEVRSEILHSEIFSAHADQNELLKWASEVSTAESKIFLTHGEIESAETFKEKLIAEKVSNSVTIPVMREVITL